MWWGSSLRFVYVLFMTMILGNSLSKFNFRFIVMRRIIFLILLMLSHVGYAGSNLYITKKEFYFDQGKCITPVEWQTYMKLDSTIKSDPHNAAQDFFCDRK